MPDRSKEMREPKASVRFDRVSFKRARAAAHLTQDELAAATQDPKDPETSLSIDTIRRAEGGIPISAESARILCAVLNVRIQDLELVEKRPQKPILLPYMTLGTLFKGRGELLRELHTSLTRDGGRTALVSSALHGLGGIGKTRAAVEYAWTHINDHTALLFLIAETSEALRRNLAAFVGPLVLNLPEQTTTDEEIRLRAVLNWLKEHPGWLLVLDNVDTREVLVEVGNLLGRVTGGQVLITSRLGSFAGQFDPVELDVLDKADATTFLLERTSKQRQKMSNDLSMAQKLAFEDLGGLALALEQAGAYVCERHISLERYRQLWRTNWSKVAGWADQSITNYPCSVAVTWQTSVDQLRPPARRLLERLAWLAPEPIPEFLLDTPVPNIETDDDFADALTDLANYSLVTCNVDRPEFSVHRLVQEVTRRGLSIREGKRNLVEVLTWVDAVFVGDVEDTQTRSRLASLEAHARTLIEHVIEYADKVDIGGPAARIMIELSDLLRKKAQYTEAELYARRAVKICEQVYGFENAETAAALQRLALSRQAQGDLEGARPLFERALEINKNVLDPQSGDLGTCLHSLALLLQAQGEFSQAELLLKQVLAIDEALPGAKEHVDTATSLNDLGRLYYDKGDFGQARAFFERAIAAYETVCGQEDIRTANCINNFSFVLRSIQRPP